jgi:hypothetical protein
VTHSCNPNYLRGRGRRQEDLEFEASLGKDRPYLKNKIQTKGLGAALVSIPSTGKKVEWVLPSGRERMGS